MSYQVAATLRDPTTQLPHMSLKTGGFTSVRARATPTTIASNQGRTRRSSGRMKGRVDPFLTSGRTIIPSNTGLFVSG